MAFSNAFAQGIEIGRSARKQRAVTKAFEALQSLDHAEDAPAPAAIPGAPAPNAVPTGAMSTSPVGEGAIEPVSAIPAAAPAAAPRTSLKGSDLDAFEKVAMEAARASGDLSVYSALNSMMTNKLQTKLLGHLRTAQVAMINGDTATAEQALKRANYYVPNGQDIKINKDETGQLTWNSPLTGKPEAITAETIGLIQAGASNPQQFSAMLQEIRKNSADAEHKAGMLANDTTRTKTDEARAAESTRASRADEAAKREELRIKRMEAESQRVRDQKYGDYLDRGGRAKGEKPGQGADISAADREKISKNIRDIVRESLQPTKSDITMDEYTKEEKVIKRPLPPPKGFEGIGEAQINQIAADAENIALLNPGMSFSEAAEMAKGRYAKAQRGGTIQRPAK